MSTHELERATPLAVRMRVSSAGYEGEYSDRAFAITGWTTGIERVARIILEAGARQVPAMIGLSRPDVRKNVPEVDSDYVGYAGRIVDLPPDTPVTLRAVGNDGKTLHTLRLPAPSSRLREPLSADIVVAHFDRSARLLAVCVSGCSAARSAQMGLTLPDGTEITGPTYHIAQNKLCLMLRRGDPAAAAHLAVFALPSKVAPEACRIWLQDGAGCVSYPMPDEIHAIDAPRSIGIMAAAFSETGILLVMGQYSFLGTTHVTIVHKGRVLASARTFQHEKVTRLQDIRSEFYLPILCTAAPGDRLTLRLEGGEHRLAEIEVTVRAGDQSRAAKVPGTPARLSNGAALYRFDSAKRSKGSALDGRPWIVYATGMSLWPVVSGGAARTYAMTRHLRRLGYRVLLVGEALAGANQDHIRQLQDLADAVAILPKMPQQQLPGREDDLMFRRHNLLLAEVLEVLELTFQPRATMVNFAFNLHGAGRLRGPVVLDAHDVQYLRTRNAKSQGGSLEDRRCTRAEETALLRRAQAVIAIQTDEAGVLQDMAGPGIPLYVIGHTLEVQGDLHPPGPDRLRRLLFIGQLYEPNVLGLRAFLDKVWPELRRRVEGVELHVVGRVCEAFRKPDPGPGVILHGVAADINAHYAHCGIAINPTLFGTGFKIKTMEGMANMLCVVATWEGTLGIPEGAPLRRVALEDFGEAIEALIANPAAAAALARRAADFVRQTCAPDVVYAPLGEMIEALPPPMPAPQLPAYFLTGHRQAGNALLLRFAREDRTLASEAPDADGGDRVAMVLHFASETTAEVQLHLSVAPRAQIEVALPLDNCFSEGGLVCGELILNGRPAGRLRTRIVMPDGPLMNHLMPLWYRQDLRSLQPVSLVGFSAERPLEPFRAGPGCYMLLSRDERIGQATGPRPDPAENMETWLKRLVFSPAHLDRLVKQEVEIIDMATAAAVAVVTPTALQEAISAPSLLLEGRGIGEGVSRTSPLVIDRAQALPVADAAVANRSGVHPSWNVAHTPQERSLTALVALRRRMSSITISFPPGTDEDNLFRWQVLLNGRPADRRAVEVGSDKATLSWARPLEPGLYSLRLVGQEGPEGAPTLPTLLSLDV